MEINELQHPDFIWTWRESPRRGRVSLWLPYLQEVRKKPRSKEWVLAFNGGEVSVSTKKLDTVMLYGAAGALPVAFLDDLNIAGVCLIIHRRNISRPWICLPGNSVDADDILSEQIVARRNETTSAYIARTLIREKIRATENECRISSATLSRLANARSVRDVLTIEAAYAARVWTRWYRSIGCPDVSRRGMEHPVNAALDACSFFLQGVMLRWVVFHRLSPCHGFLHRPTTYISLVFDLLEPYRHWINEAVSAASENVAHGSDLVPASIEALKALLDEEVYVPATRQMVRRKSLLHGAVLALSAYLRGQQTRFFLPVAGVKKGGRPPKSGFLIPGYPVGQSSSS